MTETKVFFITNNFLSSQISIDELVLARFLNILRILAEIF